jgi:hypothetical protein
MGETMKLALDVTIDNGPHLSAAWSAPVDLYEKHQFEITKIKDKKTESGEVKLTDTGKIAIIVISVSPSEGKTTLNFGGADIDINDKAPRAFVVQKSVLPIPAELPIKFSTESPKPVKIDVLVGRNAKA